MKQSLITLLLFVLSAEAAPRLVTGLHPNMYGNTGHNPQREHFSSGEPNIRAIGRLFAQNVTNCTATLLPPGDVLVTAAHCFFDKAGARTPLEYEYLFITGGETAAQGKQVGLRAATLAVVTNDPLRRPELDIAFIRLSKRLDVKKYPPAQFASITSTEAFKKDIEVRLTGYMPSNTPGEDGYATTELCTPKQYFFESKELLHNCSTMEGMSGSPVYIIRDGKITILGIHNGAARTTFGRVTDFSLVYANRAAGAEVAEAAYIKYLAGALVPDAP